MSILGLLLSLAVFGLVLYLIVTYIPMPPPVKNIFMALAVIFLIVWLLGSLGLLGGSLTAPIRLR